MSSYQRYLAKVNKFRFYRLRFAGKLPRIKGMLATARYLNETQCSMSRYGDGEMDTMILERHNFSDVNEKLSERLKEVLVSEIPGHIVAIPEHITNLRPFVRSARDFWVWHLTHKLEWWVKLTAPNKTYYSAQVTRFYLELKNKKISRKVFSELKKLWDGKELLIVEGAKSRFGVNNDLISNATSVERILCPPTNAFLHYDEILEASRRHGKGKLILIALGQTATVLAYDLAKEGFRAIDIGHTDIEYEWMRCGAKEKLAIPGKYVNEVESGRQPEDITDAKYLSEVVETIV